MRLAINRETFRTAIIPIGNRSRTRLNSWRRLFSDQKLLDDIEGSQIQNLPPFTYTALSPGTIRLLIHDPCSQPAEYAWRLETARLDDPELQFDALSYTWGTQDQTHKISLNDQCAQVHHNLYTALPYLASRSRGESQRRPIWIDAICINQANEKEKAEQITSMHRIYRLAKTVWVWLGLADEQECMSKAVSVIDKIGYAGVGDHKDYPDAVVGRETTDALGLGGLEPAVWGAVKHLLQNSWFRRVWTVQEAALAEDLVFICGEHQIASTSLKKAIRSAFVLRGIYDALGHHVDLADVIPVGMFDIISRVRESPLARYKEHEACMLMTVSKTMVRHSYQCLLPEDRVRGLLGLCQTSVLLDLKLHSLDIVRLYTVFSLYLLLEVSPRLVPSIWWGWFGLVFTSTRREGLPSWVPDLHQQDWQSDCKPYSDLNPSERPVRASNKQTVVEDGKVLSELVLRGKILEAVNFENDEMPSDPGLETGWFGVLTYLCRLADWEDTVGVYFGKDHLVNAEGPRTGEAYGELRSELSAAREVAAKYSIPEEYVPISL
jgi:hypothetical protein